MSIVRNLQKILLMAALIAMVTFNLAQAAPMLVSVTDPVGDSTGPVDVIGMDFEFNNETGNYTILLTATDAEPFAGDFRIDINLFNLDVGTTADDPSYFQDTINDFSLLVPSTSLLLSGTNERLLSWETGDRILLNNLPDGTPHPDAGTLFSSVVAGRPSQSLEKDVIGLNKEIASVFEINGASGSSELQSCIADPLPTTPKTPNTTFFANAYRGRVKMIVWREACDADPDTSVLILRVEPVPTDDTAFNPTLGGDDFSVRQDTVDYENIDLVQTVNPVSIFDGQVDNDTSFALGQNSQPYFDQDAAFTLIFSDFIDGDVPIEIPAYDATNPGLDTDILITLEEPASNSVVTGVGNLRGWAIGPQGVERVQYYIDGVLKKVLAYGGSRGDVADKYPGYPDAAFSGFASAYAYGLQDPGTHTITVRAIAASGDYNEVTHTFSVTSFHEAYFPNPEDMDISASTCSQDGSSILLNNIKVEGIPYDVKLEWQVPSQQFDIVDIQ